MAINKVVYSNTTLIDLTNDTVTADKLLSGTTAHDKAGQLIEGTITLNQFRSGSSEPSDSLGDNGDWYLVTGD